MALKNSLCGGKVIAAIMTAGSPQKTCCDASSFKITSQLPGLLPVHSVSTETIQRQHRMHHHQGPHPLRARSRAMRHSQPHNAVHHRCELSWCLDQQQESQRQLKERVPNSSRTVHLPNECRTSGGSSSLVSLAAAQSTAQALSSVPVHALMPWLKLR